MCWSAQICSMSQIYCIMFMQICCVGAIWYNVLQGLTHWVSTVKPCVCLVLVQLNPHTLYEMYRYTPVPRENRSEGLHHSKMWQQSRRKRMSEYELWSDCGDIVRDCETVKTIRLHTWSILQELETCMCVFGVNGKSCAAHLLPK